LCNRDKHKYIYVNIEVYIYIDKGEGSAGRKDAKKMTMSSRWNRKEAGPLSF